MDDKRIRQDQVEKRGVAEVVHAVSEAAVAGATVYGAYKIGKTGGDKPNKPKDK